LLNNLKTFKKFFLIHLIARIFRVTGELHRTLQTGKATINVLLNLAQSCVLVYDKVLNVFKANPFLNIFI